jgi:hypothetical protein
MNYKLQICQVFIYLLWIISPFVIGASLWLATRYFKVADLSTSCSEWKDNNTTSYCNPCCCDTGSDDFCNDIDGDCQECHDKMVDIGNELIIIIIISCLMFILSILLYIWSKGSHTLTNYCYGYKSIN